MKRRYTVLLQPDPEEGGYTVTVPALPGCVTEGDTLEEALENARDAIQSLVAYLEEKGRPVPQEASPPQLACVEV
jgi:predicted RNase H-like HicB family nuclease